MCSMPEEVRTMSNTDDWLTVSLNYLTERTPEEEAAGVATCSDCEEDECSECQTGFSR